MESENQPKISFIKKAWPVLVSLGGTSVMVLAFFIPSLQDQWDRYESRKVIEEFVTLGDNLFDGEKYLMAEEAYYRAFELSEYKRLDIEVKRLYARVSRVHENPDWNSDITDSLKEVDFQFLLHFQNKNNQHGNQVNTLNCYGIFLAKKGRMEDAKKAFDDAIQLLPQEAISYINLGNLYGQQKKYDDAEKAYRKAINIEPQNAYAHYNLGLLLETLGKENEAINEVEKAVKIDSSFRE